MRVHATDVLANQLLANANDPSWHIPFMQAVEAVTEEEAFWKPDAESNSIAELTFHLLYWNETWQKRYLQRHVDAVPPIADNNVSFLIPEGRSFQDLSSSLLEVLLRWQELLSRDSLEMTVEGFPVPAAWWEIVSNVTTHNAYHIGQIVYIQKLHRHLK
ncbi:DinB family protein [Paenibacillus donghaensis]|uniref:DltD domain-containing protein n=1 Tax=Paenibacillus donghaensis TaxID=414771 RepID=A0A2Z2KX46_9BACL|nr:DinB family protein [Paenibacillus donghaensis]ASA24768.1 DltD domain-containing protein [Paenibacillus donghaensis]